MDARPRPAIPFTRAIALLLVIVLGLAILRLATSGGDTEPVAAPSSPAGRPVASAVPPPACTSGDVPARPATYDAWNRTLVDPVYGLKPSYVPPDLVSIGRAGFREPFLIRRIVVDDLAALREAAEKAGSPVGVAAAYRSYETQTSLYRRRLDTTGREETVGKTARPGHSEHQLGTTLDFKTAGQTDVTESWEITPAGQWMAENGWRYGFVMVYPKGKEDRSCYWFEPWHFRYFGRDEAAQIHASGLTVREFLWSLKR